MSLMRLFKTVSVLTILLFSLVSCADKTAQLTPMNIVCLGDSITYGYKLNNPAMQSYPAQLAALSHGKWKVINCGVNGATAIKKGDIPIWSQEAYTRALASSPNVVVLMLGTNDIKNSNWQYKGDFVADYVALVEQLQRLPSSPQVIACLVPPILIDYPNGLTAKRQLEMNKLVKTAVRESKIGTLDIYAAMEAKPFLFIDGIHPNARGAQEIAKRVFNKINSQ